MVEEPLITQEDIEKLKSRDSRWKDVDIAIRVDEELRDSISLNLVLEAVNRRAALAREMLSEVNPSDIQAITGLQATVQCAKLITETLQGVRDRGLASAASLEDDGAIELDRDEPNGEKT